LIPAIFGENAGPLLQFTFIRNPGAAFSLGSSTTWVFTILAFVIAFYIYRTGKKVVRLSWAICLGAMLGGAIGNLIDRLFRSPGVFRGAVVDFIQIPYWAIFNIADMGVSISAVVIASMALFGKDPYLKSEK
jgi:signal peptidase II